jgi:hypothetical protein
LKRQNRQTASVQGEIAAAHEVEQHTGLDYGSFFEGLTRRIARCARRGGFAREDFFFSGSEFRGFVQTTSRDARKGRKENDRQTEALGLRAVQA